jgi:hypothetical protein
MVSCIAGSSGEFNMKPVFFLAALLIGWQSTSFGQSPVTVTFDGPPYDPPNYGVVTYFYNEGGVNFSGNFGRMHTNTTSSWPKDGSTYIQEGIGFSFDRNGSLFGLMSVDLAGYSAPYPDMAISFVGYRPDGTTITTNFSGSGLTFQTYYLGPEWAFGLTRVETGMTDWSMDNVVVATAPTGDFDYVLTTNSVMITRYNGTNGTVVVPDTILGAPVTCIGAYAFNVSGVTNVTLPSSLVSIGDFAFAYCSHLSDVEGLSSCANVGVRAFYGCGSLTNVVLPDSVTNIGEASFEWCSSMTRFDVPAGVRLLPNDVFAGCTHLAMVHLPNALGLISSNAFGGCTSLTNVNLGASITNIGALAFYFCTSLPGVVIPTNVTSIGSLAFESCATLSGVLIPAGVTNIGAGCFADCVGVSNISVEVQNPNYRSKDGVLFNKDETVLVQCPAARTSSYAIPGSVKRVEDYVFYGCGGLAQIAIPPGVTNLGQWAFESCVGLTNIAIPATVIGIGDVAFRNCKNLQAIMVDKANPAYSSLDGVLFDKNKMELVEYPAGKAGSYVVPSGVRTIDDWAFAHCQGLTKITLPGSVTNITYEAFWDCPNLTAALFQGECPAGLYAFAGNEQAILYYEPGQSGWDNTFAGLTTVLWNPRIRVDSAVAGGTNGFGFTIAGASNLVVVVEASTNPAASEWSPVGTNRLNSGTSEFRDAESANFSARFYRLTPP